MYCRINAKNIVFLFVLSISLFTSCQKEEIDTTTPVILETSKLVSFSLYGSTLDNQNNPIKDVIVKVDNYETITDENGIFHFEQIEAYGPRVKVNFEHEKFYKMYKTIQVDGEADYKLGVKLTAFENPQVFESSDGATIVSEGVKIIFPTNGIETADGGSYDGTVHVFANRFDPTHENHGEALPSDFEIIDANNSKGIMQAYSIIGVELFDQNGNPLQLSKDATIEMPVNNDLISSAPSEISISHYDSELGFWVEQGEALLEGDVYKTTVAHFSYWCAYVMQDPTNLFGFSLEDINSEVFANPIKDLYVEVSLANSAISGSTRTRDDGFFTMRVPKGIDLTLSVYASSFNSTCDDPIYTEDISALSNFLDLGNILLEAPELITITGTAVDCNSSPLNGGYLLVENQDGEIVPSSINGDGTFSLSMYNCNTSVNVTAYDIDFLVASETLSLANLTEDIVFESIVACEPITSPPFLLKVFTGGDTLIGSSNSGSNVPALDNEGNIMSLVWAYFDADIQNTTQPLNEGSMGIIISMEGLEEQQCFTNFCEIAIPLKDDEGVAKIFRVQPSWEATKDSWAQIYNCIDGAEYLHLIGEGFIMEGNTGEITTLRDPLVEFEIYFPL